MSVGDERFKQLIEGPLLIPTHAGNVLHITAVSEKRVSGGRQDQGLNLEEFYTLECALECALERGRARVARISYL